MITFTDPAPAGDEPPLPQKGGSYILDTAAGAWVPNVETVPGPTETPSAPADAPAVLPEENAQ